MPNQTLGIDHPVVTVRDHAAVLDQYRAIGFSPSPVSYHPWGTVLSLMMFRDNFIEVIGVADASKFGTNSVNGFCYGRNVGAFLDRAEGLSLVALHSKDADGDHARLTGRGLKSQGRIDFRRAMTKADGTPDVAVVSLGLFLNEAQRDVSHFICHQHRPELIWVPEWQNHPNGVHAITSVTYLAAQPRDLLPRFEALYGKARPSRETALTVDTGCGVFRSLHPGSSCRTLRRYAAAAVARRFAARHCHRSGDVEVRRARSRSGNEMASNTSAVRTGTLLLEPRPCGNVILEFAPDSAFNLM